MDNFTKGTLIALSLQLSILGYAVARLSYQLGYARGQVALMTIDHTETIGGN